MDAAKLQKYLEGMGDTPEGKAKFAKYVTQIVGRLTKAVDHLAKAAKHVGAAMEHNEKMSEHMDALGDHHDAMEGHMAGMKDCMGKAIATGKLGKVEDAGDAKDMTTHLSGIESAHGEMGKTHGAIEKLIGEQEDALDNAEGAIDDAVDSADEETDKGLAAAERTEKMRKRGEVRLKKNMERKHSREMTVLTKTLTSKFEKAAAANMDALNQLVKALTPKEAPPADAIIHKVTPIRTAPIEKVAGAGGVPGAVSAAAVGGGGEIAAVDQYGMPNPEFVKGVETGLINDDKEFAKAAGKVEAQIGDPFPKNDDDLFVATRPRGAVA